MTEDQFGPAGRESIGAAEEQALRSLLHRAVDDLQPTPDALARIRRAVPVRRARYRQAWTGAAVIAVLTAAAVPTLHGLGALELSDGSAARAGAGVTAGGSSAEAQAYRSLPADDDLPLPGFPNPAPTATPSPSAVLATVTDSAPAPVADGGTAGTAAAAPDCLRADLGRAGSVTGSPDSTGRLYGIFTVTNVSGHACVLADPGTVTAGGGTGQIRVVAHRVGDQAVALPDPATLTGRLLLAPSAGYRLVFAWVPDALCPAAGSASATATVSGGPSPSSGSASAAPSGASGSAGPTLAGASPGAASAGSTPAASASASASAQPSVSATASPSAGGAAVLTVGLQPVGTGAEVASAAITGVCGGGTLYRSLPQPAS